MHARAVTLTIIYICAIGMFIIQKQRAAVLNWLQRDTKEANEVMESIVKVVTMTGTSPSSA